jgi:hypothetical protein
MENRWLRAWKDLPQETIRSFVERIPYHIKEIIRLEGGNEYKERIPGFKRSWKGNRLKGKLSTHAFVDPSLSNYKAPTQHQERQEISDHEVLDGYFDDEGLWESDAEERFYNTETQNL